MECREGDASTLAILTALRHRETALACAAERAFMRRLEGGCSAPVAAHAEVRGGGGGVLAIEGGVWSLCGTQSRTSRMTRRLPDLPTAETSPAADADAAAASIDSTHGWVCAEELGRELAEELLGQGAGPILDGAKELSAGK